MRIEYETELGVRLLKTIDIDGFVYHLVNHNPTLAQEISDKIAFQIQDNNYLLNGEHDAS